MQVRRARTEHLQLVTLDGTTVELATAHRLAGAIDSQDELAVSPDGAYLAWSASEVDRLHVRDAAGHDRVIDRYRHRMRFSPDGKWLAALTTVGRGDWSKLVAYELATGRMQTLLAAQGLGRFEWTAGGLVIQEGEALVHVSLAGETRRVLELAAGEHLQRFSAAASASRVLVFVDTSRGPRLRSLDFDHPGVHELGAVPGARVDNAEMSPDGSRGVIVTPSGLYIVEGDRAPRELSGRNDVHSLWFTHDGRLAYAASGAVTVLDGKRAHRLEQPITMMRLDRPSSAVLLATGGDVRTWDAATDQQTVLATAPAGSGLLGAEHFRGGTVLWTETETNAPAPYVSRVLRVRRDGTSNELERVDQDVYPDRFFSTLADGTVVYRGLDAHHVHVTATDGKDRDIAASSVVVAPSGDRLLLGRYDADAYAMTWSVADAKTGTERWIHRQQTSVLTTSSFEFSPDGKLLAAVERLPDGREALYIYDLATGQIRVPIAARSLSFSWTPRGLLVQEPNALDLVSPSGEVRSILDEATEPGLASVYASRTSTRVVACFRGGTEGVKKHPGMLAFELDAPAQQVELDVPLCWNRGVSVSSDGEQIVFADVPGNGNALAAASTRGGAAPRQLGEGYPDVTFGGHGRIAFASHRGVHFVDGAREAVLETDAQIENVELAADGTVHFTSGRELIAWDPVKNTRTVLARAPEGQRIVAAAPSGSDYLLVTIQRIE